MADYMPRNDGDKAEWYNNYSTKIATRGPTVGLTAAEISAIQSQIGGYLSQFNSMVQQKNTLQSTTATTRQMEKDLLTALRKQVGRLKDSFWLHTSYRRGFERHR